MEAQNYAEVDFMTPMMHLGVGGILLVFAIPLIIHALFRKRRFARLTEGYQTYKSRSSIRTEMVTGALCLAAALVFGVLAWTNYSTATSNLAANIEQRYQPAEFTLGSWNGSWATVDITLEDGTRFTDSVVVVRAGNEPFIEDVWYHTRDNAD